MTLETAMETGAALTMRGVSKRYRGSRTWALRDLSLEVPRGYVMGLLGKNGAGKTTLIKLACGLLKADSGDIRVLGADPERSGPELRRFIGYVSEAPQLYNNLSLRWLAGFVAGRFPAWDEAYFRQLLRRLDLRDHLGDRFGKLSKGTKVKFALALALAHRPKVLLLDEPTSGLDPAARREVLSVLLEALRDGETAVVFSSHITSDVEKIADFVTIIDRGRVLLTEDKETLLNRVVRAVLPREAGEWLERLGEEGPVIHWQMGRRRITALIGDLDEFEALYPRALPRPFDVTRMNLEDIFVALTDAREE